MRYYMVGKEAQMQYWTQTVSEFNSMCIAAPHDFPVYQSTMHANMFLRTRRVNQDSYRDIYIVYQTLTTGDEKVCIVHYDAKTSNKCRARLPREKQ